MLIHLGLLYAILHIWAGVSDYRLLIVRLILIAIMFTLSLNVVNGYMGEFSCSHPGFIALGAYAASIFTVSLFIDDNLLGPAILPGGIGIFFFPIGFYFSPNIWFFSFYHCTKPENITFIFFLDFCNRLFYSFFNDF